MSIQTPLLTPSAAVLQFKDSASCTRWLAGLPVTNAQLSQQQLSEQLTTLAATPMAALERLKILEALRESVAFAQSELAKRYAGKPLPLDQGDAKTWNNVVGLWRTLDINYRHCLDAYRKGDLAIAPLAALVILRCLRATASGMFEHYAVYREPDAAAWRAFHELFAFAEAQGLSRMRVQDVFAKRDPVASCTDAYLQGLLGFQANPHALSVRQMSFLQRWLEQWASLVTLSSQPLPAGQIPALAVDFAGDAGPGLASTINPSASVRYLELDQLSKSLQQTMTLLKQGQTPAQLGLGEDARQPTCENLVFLLYLQWCRAGTLRQEERTAPTDPVDVSFGIADAHKLLAGIDKAVTTGEINARDKWEIDNLGFSMRMSSTARQAAVKRSELWQILNQSASGFMCMLRDPAGVMRMTHNQLLGVRRADSPRIGTVQWIRVTSQNETTCGVRLFPGTPNPVKVRPANPNAVKGPDYEPAFMTPVVTMPAAPATIILPAGWYQNGRLLEIQGEDKRVVKLVKLIERGADYDRCSVE
jgi:cyclic-di-GMP-binding protein